ncbi:MAG: hypothetical protein WCC63_04455 [Candidatus Bathyarchaeia archaeon]
MAKKKETAVHLPAPLKRYEARRDSPWPSPTPLPSFPIDDAGLVLKQILVRLSAIEKRLENIEKMLKKDQRAR